MHLSLDNENQLHLCSDFQLLSFLKILLENSSSTDELKIKICKIFQNLACSVENQKKLYNDTKFINNCKILLINNSSDNLKIEVCGLFVKLASNIEHHKNILNDAELIEQLKTLSNNDMPSSKELKMQISKIFETLSRNEKNVLINHLLTFLGILIIVIIIPLFAKM
jgi:hypothetical protein